MKYASGLSAAALLVLFTASARTRIVRINLLLGTLLRRSWAGLILICAGHLCDLLTFHLLLYLYVEQQTNRILLDTCAHCIEHLIRAHLVLDKRISLAVSLQSDTLTQLIHIVDVIHPLPVDDFQKNDTLQLTDLLLLYLHEVVFPAEIKQTLQMHPVISISSFV